MLAKLEDQPQWIIGKKRLSEQVKRLRARFAQSVGEGLNSVMSAQSLQRAVEQHAGRWRDRLYGPLTTLELFTEQILSPDRSCQDAVARGLSLRVAMGKSGCSLNTGPYCKARARLKLGLIEHLSRHLAGQLGAKQPEHWRWRGRELKLADGTTVSMPDTAANQRCFPQNREQAAGLGFPLARVVGIVSLSTGAVLDWATGPCEGEESGETALLWKMAPGLKAGDVLIADRYFAGYFMLARLKQLGVDVIVQANRARHTDFRCGTRLGARDHVVHWERPRRPAWMDAATYEQMPLSLPVREVRVGGLTLVTTLLNPKEVSKDELHQIYIQRWNVELDLRSIKSAMEMDVLRCKNPQMVTKEIGVHLLAYNLVRALMAKAAQGAGLLPRQLSFKGALHLINAFQEALRRAPRARLSIMQAHLLGAIASLKLPHRPGRVEPRAIKRRPKEYPRLTQPRHVARARLLRLRLRWQRACLR
jgi:hypothetical protein